jgi:hypothetical protein
LDYTHFFFTSNVASENFIFYYRINTSRRLLLLFWTKHTCKKFKTCFFVFFDFSIFCTFVIWVLCKHHTALVWSVMQTWYCHFDDVLSRMINVIEKWKCSWGFQRNFLRVFFFADFVKWNNSWLNATSQSRRALKAERGGGNRILSWNIRSVYYTTWVYKYFLLSCSSQLVCGSS